MSGSHTTPKFGAIASAATLAIASGTQAKVPPTIVTYTGTVTSGFDTSGVFGAPNTSLVGDQFNVILTINRRTPGSRLQIGSLSSMSDGSGSSDPVNADIVIDGTHFVIGSGGYGSIFSLAEPFGGPQELTFEALEYTDTFIRGGIFNQFQPTWAKAHFWDPMSYNAQPGDEADAIFQADDLGYSATAKAAFSSVQVVNGPLTVPEPAGWAMLLTGSCGIGGIMRARRRLSSPEAAWQATRLSVGLP
jgi:hypothetical protein